MTEQKVATREQWQAARRELLELEKERAERARELTRRRQELPWVSSFGSDFSFDFGFAFTPEQIAGGVEHDFGFVEISKLIDEAPDWLQEWAVAVGTDLAHGLREGPGWIAFALLDDVVHHTYVRYAPGDLLEPFYYQLLDMVPSGRGHEFRVTRHDEYDDAPAGAR